MPRFTLFWFRRIFLLTFGLVWIGLLSAVVPASAQVDDRLGLSAAVKAQIATLQNEKASRTPAQKKLNSQLVYAVKINRNQAIAQGVTNLKPSVNVSANGRVLVDLKATVTPTLLTLITNAGGTVVSSHTRYKSIRAQLPLTALEAFAGRGDVQYIRPADVAMTSSGSSSDGHVTQPPAWLKSLIGIRRSGKQLKGSQPSRTAILRASGSNATGLVDDVGGKSSGSSGLGGGTTNTGSLDSEGDAAHAADTARTMFSVDGTGVKIGVLSDSVDGLATAQGSGDLPATVTVLSGQAGSGAGEGTAMLEIVHDIAPGAELFFATGFGGAAQMAQNILDLRTAGCDIIIDDVSYGFDDGPFQDGLISQAVNDVSADGALYFSSAANSGNKNDGTSGTYEGDFLSGGAATGVLAGAGTVHDFGGSTTSNIITKASNGAILYWADPLGGSSNDYDLFLLNAAGDTVDSAGTNTQDGTQDPVESVGPLTVGQQLVVVQTSGAANRFFHIDALRGQLTINTQGSTRGHNASGAANAFSVAATDANNSAPAPFVGGTTNPVETFSSDGPRRVFFNEAGTAITPGDFSSTGGQVLQKPDITAADGVQCVTSGFNPFFGTSAAAPHAGALAALLMELNPALTPAQIRDIMQQTALDIEDPGVDRDSGFGIIMANRFLQAANGVHLLFNNSEVDTAGGNFDGVINPDECNTLFVDLQGSFRSSGNFTNISATLSTSTPGVTVTQPNSTYPDISSLGIDLNNTPFQISTSAGFVPGTPIDFTLNTTYTGGADVITFTVSTGILADQIFNGTIDGGDLTQTGRLNRAGGASTCANDKTNPGLNTNVGARGFDSFNFTNGSAATCVTVKLDNPNHSTNQAYAAAYSGSFNPADPSANYLADMGTSSTSTTMSFDVAANQTIVVVVHEITAGQGVPNYTLTVGGLISTATGGGACSPPPSISIDNKSVTEGNTGTTNATFTVTLSAASAQTVTVDFATSDGNLNPATAGSDYTSTSGTLTFTPGQTSKTIDVPIIGDTLDENNEQYFVDLSNPTNATINDGHGIGTIVDDDPITATLSINDVTFNETTGPVTNAAFTVTLSSVSGRAVTVNYTTADGTAHTPDDYNARSGTLTFLPGQTSKTIAVGVKNDNVDEVAETFKINLSGASGATIADNQGVCTIMDDDTSAISINDVTIVENDSGPKNMKFTVSLSNPSSQTVTVAYATADNTAKAGSDYVATSGTVTFSIGQTVKTFIVQSTGDLLDEDNETYFANLSNPTGGATIADNQGIGTINDDDPANSISINDITFTEGNSGTANCSFTVTLSAVTGRTVTVNFATANGTATAGSDYNARSGIVTFLAGQTSKTITVGVKGDTLFESDESFKVNLSGAVGANIADNQGVCTITNDDPS